MGLASNTEMDLSGGPDARTAQLLWIRVGGSAPALGEIPDE